MGFALDALIAALGWLLRWFLYFFAWIFYAIFDPLIAWFVTLIPDVWVERIANLVVILTPYIEAANLFVPVSEAAMAFVLYLNFVTLMFCVKMFWHLVPTGG